MRHAAPLAPESAGGLPIWAVLTMLVVGLLARTPRLSESLWYDEIAAWRQFGAQGPRQIVSDYSDPANHVAHTLLTWISVGLAEPALGAELALRLPALLCSLASIVVMMGLARLAAGPRAALIAGGLTAVLPVSVLEGVEARGYSMMILLSAASTFAWCTAWTRPGALRWAGYALLAALGVWTHPMAVFVPLGHGAWLLWKIGRRGHAGPARGAAMSLLLAAVVTSLLYAPLIPQMIQLRRGLQAASADQPRLLGAEGWHALLQLGGAWVWWAALPGWALIVSGVTRCRDWTSTARPVVTAAIAGLPLFLLAVLIGGTWVYARFMLFAFPAAILLMAIGIDRWLSWRPIAGVVLSAAVIVASAVDLATRPPKQPLREAAEWVAARALAGEPIVVVGLAHRVLDAYSGDLALAYSLAHGVDLAERLDEIRPRWVIGYYLRHIDQPTRATLRDRGYAITQRFPGWVDWDNGDVVVWERRTLDSHH